MHTAALFRRRGGTVVVAYNSAHQASALVFTVFLAVYETGVSLAAIFRGYACCLAAFALVHGALVQPGKRLRDNQRHGALFVREIRGRSDSTVGSRAGDRFFPGDRAEYVARVRPPWLRAVRESVGADAYEKRERPSFCTRLRAVAFNSAFLPLLAYKTATLLSLQFFVAVLQPRPGRKLNVAAPSRCTFLVRSVERARS